MSDYLAGDDLTIADIALLPVLDARKDVLATSTRFEHLKVWEQRMHAVPGVTDAIAAS